MAKRSTISVFFLLNVIVFMLPSILIAQRCDRQVNSNIWHRCTECNINVLQGCPIGYHQVTSGEGVQRCTIFLNFGPNLGRISVPGCQHLCRRTLIQKECCSGFWGQDCQACPGSLPCSGRGSCSDKVTGNGTCICQDGFKGFACELCKDSNKFGSYCNETCHCVHGQCDSGLLGTGHCRPDSCHLGHQGQDCNIALPNCTNPLPCAVNAGCFKINNTDSCICDPGYRNVSNTCNAINHCIDGNHGCHSNADCFYLGPGKHNCTCASGYTGDGTVCVAIDPCQRNNGDCPSNSTICNFLQPGESNCSCLPGFQNYTSGAGCVMIDLCENGGGCDVHANCTMIGPGVKRCDCKNGYRGNGTTCYGNILQRVKELNLQGPNGLKGQLNTAIDLLTGSFVHQALAGAGPFTLFLMVDDAFANLTQEQKAELTANLDMASHFVSRHLVAGDFDSFALKKYGRVATLEGINATIAEYQNVTYFKLDGHYVNASVLFNDLLAGNGMIHVIDKIMWHVGDYQETRSKSSLQVLFSQSRFKVFASLLQSSGIASELAGLGAQFTLLAPVNSAFSAIDNSTMRFLTDTDAGRRKMKSLLRNHILTGKFSILDLLYSGKVVSVEGESVIIKLHSRGLIVLGEDAVVISSNILASDGVLHALNKLLIPDDIQPLLPRYCNRKSFSRGICYRCSAVQALPTKGCPRGYSPSNTTSRCLYRLFMQGGFLVGTYVGCTASTCSIEVPECCAGYYGAPCHPCPGPFGNACNGNGKCFDRVRGNGSCICQPMFKGTACELCDRDDKFGPSCNQTCTCLHGKCDNGPTGNGTCVPHSCSPGFHGDNCDQRDVPCADPSISLRCHVFASCVRQGNVDSCQCNAGYEGSGTFCSEINPCTKPSRGGCHHEAVCTMTGPGTNNCTCQDGFRGDGVVCVAIDPCQEKGAGYCHSNAECRYIGPGQSTCVCKPGYTGDGSSCNEVNYCLVNHGGCSPDAQCVRTGPGNHSCKCNTGFIGNGYFCLGSVATIIGRMNPRLENFIRQANLLHYLSDPTSNLTLFAPSVTALSLLSDADKQYWTNSTERLQYLIRYHLVDKSYSLEQLKGMNAFNASNGLTLNITTRAQMVYIGDSAKVVQANVTTENGFVHIINKVLLPPRLSSENQLPLTSELLKNISEFSDFYSILKSLQLLSLLDACDACTVFAPTNAALKNYVLLQNNNLSVNTLKYHVVKRYLSEETMRNGEEYSSWLGDNFLVKVTKPGQGMLRVNGIEVVIKGQKARKAMVFGINGVLEPVRRNCDEITRNYFLGYCTYCPIFNPWCGSGLTKVGVRQNACRIRLGWFILPGCRAICLRTTTIKKCCSGFWGVDCQSCPGNLSDACSSNGVCDDGKSGSGHCQCSANFTGTACEKCISGKYGTNCTNECNCVNGTCNEGISGDGTCFCHHGWKGKNCNVSANYKNCLPTVCSRFATCRGPAGSGRCDCDAGYTGNGTNCAAIDTCIVNNGGCHRNATCSIDMSQPGFRSCQCNDGFTGDGFICVAIDPCQTNNGGCHSNATCAYIGPGKSNCFCKKGYSGDGVSSCVSINPCNLDNGGCSDRADCRLVGPYQRRCVCRQEYVGDGFTCIGDITEALKLDPELSQMDSLLRRHGLDKLLGSHGYFNLLAPTNAALGRSQLGSRKRRSVNSPSSNEETLLKYHIISCATMSFKGNSVNFTTLLGAFITVKKENNMTYFYDSHGNASKAVGAYESSNGIVLKVDNVLSPPSLPAVNPKVSYIDLAKNSGYGEFAKLVELAGLRKTLDTQVNRPLLMFWPTDYAINNLPVDFQNKLRDPQGVLELIHFIQYHVVAHIQPDFSIQSFLRTGAGLELRSLGRSSLFVSCKGGKGDLFVNGDSKLIERDLIFDGGVAFGVDKVLIPLGFGGNCDVIKETHIMGQCGNCFVPVSCPQDTSLVSKTNHNCTYSDNLLGCQPICLRRERVKRCCSNFYGPSCLACPGGIQLPCSRRGNCIDGLEGDGSCVCDTGYNGTACESCIENSDSCPVPSVTCNVDNGGCHVFAVCHKSAVDRVTCSCKPGYRGDGYYCQMIDVCATNNGGCSVNATCFFVAPGTKRCQCKPGFFEVGSTCQPHHPNSPCSQNHGGCSAFANCVDNGNGVTCTCRPGFAGDGFTCEGTIIEALIQTKKATEFYKVLYELRAHNSDAMSLYNDLQNPQGNFTVFVPVNSAVTAQKFTLHVLKNHILSGRLPLNNVKGDLSVTTMAGTKLLIKKLPNGEVLINGVAHIVGDIPASNGLVHVIDQMIPVIGPSPPTTVTPTKVTSTKLVTTAVTEIPTTTQTVQPGTSTTTETLGPSVPGVNANARKQEGNSVGSAAIAGIIIGSIMFVLLIFVVLWLLKKNVLPSRTFHYKKSADTVHFSNEAYSGTNSSVSFDNVLYDNFEAEPVLMQPLDFPIDDKQPVPQGNSPDHLDYDNPLYRDMMGLDSLHPSVDSYFRQDTKPVTSEEGIKEFANPMYADFSEAKKRNLKLNLDSSYHPGGEDTC